MANQKHFENALIEHLKKFLTMDVVVETSMNELFDIGPPLTKSGTFLSFREEINENGKWVIIFSDKDIKNLSIYANFGKAPFRVLIDPTAFKTDEEAVMFMMGGGISYD
jgi:hypothetical protein